MLWFLCIYIARVFFFRAFVILVYTIISHLSSGLTKKWKQWQKCGVADGIYHQTLVGWVMWYGSENEVKSAFMCLSWSLRKRMRAVEIRALRGSNSALHYSGSTLSGGTNPIVDPQNAMRFDFTKSAICRRFCKVRLLKHPTGMFYPLRMTRGGRCLAELFCISSSVILFGCHLLPRRRLGATALLH